MASDTKDTTGFPMTLAKSKRTIAFAFDIDGVLVKGSKPVPGARETLKYLQANHIPFIFLTNSGGLTEEANLEKLALRLGNISFDPDQIVQSHTPFRALVPEYAHQTILALGGHGDKIRELAHAYGFRDVLTSSDLHKNMAHTHPFPEMTADHHNTHAKTWTIPRPPRIAAIMVWSSPRDWCLDLQVTLDLLLSSGGVVGTRSARNGDDSLPNAGYQQDGQPKLFFCNPDFEWKTQHAQPRLAQGAFRAALKGLWAETTGGRAQLEYNVCGKPTEQTYIYGEQALQKFHGAGPAAEAEISTVYMIGDNPASDIAGANAYVSRYGSEWRSILVETGVHVAGSTPAHMPHHVARDVKQAVQWALAQPDI